MGLEARKHNPDKKPEKSLKEDLGFEPAPLQLKSEPKVEDLEM